MKAVIAVIVVIIILAGGGIILAKHHSNKSTPASTTTSSSASSNKSSSSSTSSSSTSSTATNTVAISGFAFSPANITVKVGTTVTWTNKDSVAHTVSETDGQDGPNSSDLNQGQSYSFTYKTAGTFKYDCSIHTYMTGSVTVTN